MKYIFIEKHDEYSVTKWAEVLGIERSGYYSWLNKRDARKEEEDLKKKAIKKIFNKSLGTYGPDRIAIEMRRTGHSIGRKKTCRYMAEMGLDSCHNKHRSRSLTNSKNARDDKKFPNLLKKEIPIVPRMGLSSDITYIKSDEGFEYLCIIKDIVTNEILGESSSKRMTKEIVINALLSVLAKHRLLKDCIFHSDRGSQFTSKAVMAILKQYGIRQSFSRVGMPGDNAWSESFFATMKKECIHWHHFKTRQQIKDTVFGYIYGFYNVSRIQKRLGYISPKEYCKRFDLEELLDVA